MDGLHPIKRSTQLQPLSREHHDGLLYVWKIREGLDNAISIERLMKYTSWYWIHHIKPHFFQEEKLLMPFMTVTHPMVIQLQKEHDYIRELIISIDKEADRHDFIRLANLIESHIRFEERELYQYLEEHLAVDQLDEIYEKLEKHPLPINEEWKDHFWVKKDNK